MLFNLNVPCIRLSYRHGLFLVQADGGDAILKRVAATIGEAGTTRTLREIHQLYLGGDPWVERTQAVCSNAGMVVVVLMAWSQDETGEVDLPECRSLAPGLWSEIEDRLRDLPAENLGVDDLVLGALSGRTEQEILKGSTDRLNQIGEFFSRVRDD